MAVPFHHGITGNEPIGGVVPIQTTATAVIGLIAYADDADPAIYPLDTPVLVTSMSRAFIGAGYEGTLRKSLEAIQPITNPTIVIVRIADPFSDAGLNDSLVIGSTNGAGERSGIQALLTAKSVLGVTPKINIAPWLETPDVVQALIAVNKKLRAYSYVTPRDEDGVMLATQQLVVAYRDTIGAREIELIWPEWTSGNVLLSPPAPSGMNSILLHSNQNGSGNDLLPNVGDTLSVSVNGVTTVSEAWTEELHAEEGAADAWVTRALLAAGLNVIPDVTGDVTFTWLITAPGSGSQTVTITPTSAARIKFRINENDLLNPVTFTLSAATAGAATYGSGILSAVATAAALRAETDERIGFHKTISNIVVIGPTGISKAITWDLEDPDTDAGYLNSNQITTMIQHQGLRFWGNRNCASDPQFVFETSTRTAQILMDSLLNACFPYVDQPLTQFLAKDIIDSFNAYLAGLSSGSEKRLMGGKAWYDNAQNSTEQLNSGIMAVDYDYSPIVPFEHGILNQRITGRYYVDFGQLISGAGAVTEG